MKPIPLLLYLLAAFPLASNAQPPEEEGIPQQSFTFLIMSANGDPEMNPAEAVFYFEDNSGVNGVSLPPGGMAGPFTRALGTHLDLFRLETVPPGPDQPPGTPPRVLRHPLRQVPFPEQARNVFVLVNINPRTGAILHAQAINQSADVLPPGHLGLMSFLDRPITVRLGEEGGALPEGGRLMLPVRRGRGARPDMVLFLAGGADANGDMQVLASRRISVNPNFRRLALLFPSADGTVNILMLPPAPEDPPDLPPPEEGME